VPRLRRSRLDAPAIHRRRYGAGFRFTDASGWPIADPETIERIRALVIPPAWKDVWICPWPNGHIQAVGTDAAGRRQYRYHDEWRRRRDAEKFSKMLEFGSALPGLRAATDRDLVLEGMPRERTLALAVQLLDCGLFRVGGEEYAEEHQTFGLATLERNHVRIRNGQATFDYAAKGGIERKIAIDDPALVELIGELKYRRDDTADLLAWQEEGEWVDVRAADINQYLKEISGGPFTAKDFRTWTASLLAALLLAGVPRTTSPSQRARATAAVVRAVAAELGNTPAVCRRSYVDPRVLDRFERGDTLRAVIAALPDVAELKVREVRARLELAFVEFLAEPEPSGLELAA